MKRVAFALALSGVLLLATWVQAPAAPARDVANPSAADMVTAEQVAQAVAPAARQVDDEAERLRQHLAAQTPFTPPVRDPFRFTAIVPKTKSMGSEPFSTVSAEKGTELAVMRPPASPPIEMPTLLALTEDTVAGVVTRTAMLSMGDDMAIVKVGQTFARFQIQQIGATSVELVDVTSAAKTITTITIR